MNTVEHYREAEAQLAEAHETTVYAEATAWIASAQVHAILALVGATVAERAAPYSDENAALFAAVTEGQ